MEETLRNENSHSDRALAHRQHQNIDSVFSGQDLSNGGFYSHRNQSVWCDAELPSTLEIEASGRGSECHREDRQRVWLPGAIFGVAAFLFFFHARRYGLWDPNAKAVMLRFRRDARHW